MGTSKGKADKLVHLHRDISEPGSMRSLRFGMGPMAIHPARLDDDAPSVGAVPTGAMGGTTWRIGGTLIDLTRPLGQGGRNACGASHVRMPSVPDGPEQSHLGERRLGAAASQGGLR